MAKYCFGFKFIKIHKDCCSAGQNVGVMNSNLKKREFSYKIRV